MFDIYFPLSLKKQQKGERHKLYRLAMSWCGDRMLADDLVQDCMLKARQNRHQLTRISHRTDEPSLVL